MDYESSILKRLIDTYGVVGNPRYISEIIKEFIVQGKERFPNLFTYQADWLAHIDEFGLNPSYTVSYTGQSIYAPNTLERPVKSAILKGNTLVNIPTTTSYYVTNKNNGGWVATFEDSVQFVKPNTKYYIGIFNNSSESKNYGLRKDPFTNETKITISPNGYGIMIGTTVENITSKALITNKSEHSSDNDVKILFIEYQDGMENWNIPYFEGMQSVQMPVLTTTGKNLICVGRGCDYIIRTNGLTITRDIASQTITFDGTADSNNVAYSLDTLLRQEIKKGERYAISCSLVSGTADNISFRVNTKDWSSSLGCSVGLPGVRTFNEDVVYDGCTFRTDEGMTFNNAVFRVMFEKVESNSNETSYEPFKSNILTVNEPVELRGIGEVQDTLDLTTGTVTKKIDYLELTPSMDWTTQVEQHDSCYSFYINTPLTSSVSPVMCNQFNNLTTLGNGEGLLISGTGRLNINILKTKLNDGSLESFKTWLKLNPIQICYVVQETVKTVDLNILDQNGQNIKQLMSFNGGTHFNTGSAEGSPLPLVSVSVETDLEETLRVCSLEGNTL